MKYILFKSKIFGDTKINLTEAIEGKKIVLNESISHENIKDIEKAVSSEYKKNLPDVKKEIESIVGKILDSTSTEEKIEKVVINCMVQFYKQLYLKSSIWVNSLKK